MVHYLFHFSKSFNEFGICRRIPLTNRFLLFVAYLKLDLHPPIRISERDG